MKKSTIKIGIVRGLMPRVSQAEFANSFTNFSPIFITGSAEREVKDYCLENNLENRDLEIRKVFLVDPVSILFGKTTHQSWVSVRDLSDVCRDLDCLETYELYHFFSGEAADISKKLKIPLVTEVWTSFLHPAYFVPPYSLTVYKVLRQTDLFVARSNLAKEALMKLGVPDRKIRVIYQGVNLRKFFPAVKKGRRRKVFLFVGEMEEYKGVKVLIEAWRIYSRINPYDMLWFAGKGRIKPEGENTKNFGFVKYKDLSKIYRMADVFVAPSVDRYIGPFKWWEEFFSYALMEAAASGLSIIGSDSGGIPEEIGSENIIVRQGNVADLVDAMLNIKRKNSNRRRAEEFFDINKNTACLEKEIYKLL